MLCYTTYSSPLGKITLISDETSLTGLYMDTQPMPEVPMARRDDLPIFNEARRWLDRYFRGEKPPVTFPLSSTGTPFQMQVWEILLRVPYGKTTTYGAIAKELSPTMSAQAVGGAVGRNPISIIIPCHRCIGSSGKLVGYTGGLDKKTWLLRHEEETI